MQTVPYILGIAHPTAFPTFVLLGWLFTHLFPLGEVAWRMNLFCALAVAGACWLLYRVLRDRDLDPGSALGAALVFAAGPIVWAHAVHTEVHDLALLFFAVVVYFALRWYRDARPRDLYLCALCGALAVGNHEVAVLLVPGVLVLVLARWRALRLRVVALTLACIVAGAMVYAYLPIRSAIVYAERKDPTLSIGLPPGRPYWDYDHPSSWDGFVQVVTGSQFHAGSSLSAIVTPSAYAQFPAYWARLLNEYGWVPLALALIGALRVLVRRPLMFAGLFLCGFVALPFVLNYPAESDIERYFMPSFWIVGLAVGFGTSALAKLATASTPQQRRSLVTAGCALVILGACAVGTVRRNEWIAATSANNSMNAFINVVINGTPENAIIISPWLTATGLAYAAYVQHRFGDRILETAWYTDDAQYIDRWVKERPVVIVGDPTYPLAGYTFAPIGTNTHLYQVVPAP
jgi:hypothetical protein